MITTALLILCFTLVFVGVGLLLPNAVFRRAPSFDGLAAAFWTGLALALAFLQLWHLIRPVDGLPLLISLAAAAAGWMISRQPARDLLRTWVHPTPLILTALALIPALVLANHVMFVPAHSDHGLYHLQTVKWISTYAIVPGLGNLHHRLAFNNANFLLAALLNAGPLAGRAYFTANTLLAYVLMIQCAAAVVGLLRFPRTPSIHQVYYALMLAPVIWHLSTTHLPGYSPDVPVFVLQVVLGGELLRLFDLGADRARFIPQGQMLALLAAAGIAVKLSFIVFGALILLAVAGLWLARFGFSRRTDLRVWLAWAGLAALLVIPWMARGAVLSGYLLYPSTALPLPVAWRIPLHLAEPVAGVITTWARTASSQIAYTADLAWFLNWQRFLVYEARAAFVASLAVLALDGLIALRLRRKRASGSTPPVPPQEPVPDSDRQINPLAGPLALLGISAVALVYWFILAPDYRFSGAIFWTFLVAALLLGYTQLLDFSPLFSLAPASSLALGLLLILALWLAPNQFSKNLSPRLLLNPVLEPALADRYQNLAQAQVRTTASGVSVYTPAQNGQDCWNLPLPCVPTNDFTSQLHLFAPGNLQKGFYIRK